MASPATSVRTRVKEIIADEFAAEGWTAADDRFGRSKGMEIAADQAAIAVYPEREVERDQRVIELVVPVRVQFHLGYEAEPDETIVRDPGVVEGYADRLRRAFKDNSSGTTSDLWFLRLREIEYPPDPTGNITRFEALVEGHCDNPASLPG